MSFFAGPRGENREEKRMSSRVFQSVILQMKDATDRCMGVADEQGFVIACSELALIGSHLEDMLPAMGEEREQIFASAVRTYKLLGAIGTRFDYAVFVSGDDAAARGMFVTPRDIDASVRSLAKLLGYAVNLALHDGLTVADVDLLKS